MRKYTIKEQLNSETGKQEETLFVEDILEDEVINKKVVGKIREKYNLNEELKMLRLGILDNNNVEYQTYNTHVESCRTWGNEKKVKALKEKEYWKDKYRKRDETEKEFISRLKLAEPIIVEPEEPIELIK